MRTDVSQTKFHEAPSARADFSQEEIRKCRLLLRRLRFLEEKIRTTGGLESGTGGGAFAEMEAEATEWILREIGYLAPAGT